MRSFIRFNGTETSMDNVCVVEPAFNEMLINELRKVFGEKAQFRIEPAANFIKEEHTDNIFTGVITGQFEGEAPVNISVFFNPKPIEELNLEELPDADMVVPAFFGFRK